MTDAKADADAGSQTNLRKRWRVSPDETRVLEMVFALTPRPNKAAIQQLSATLRVTPRQVQVWFQNRRQRWRKEVLETQNIMPGLDAAFTGKAIPFEPSLLPPPIGFPAGPPAAAGAPGPFMKLPWHPAHSPPLECQRSHNFKAEALASGPPSPGAFPPPAPTTASTAADEDPDALDVADMMLDGFDVSDMLVLPADVLNLEI